MLPMRDWRLAMRERTEGLWTDLGWNLLVAERGGQVIGAASGSYLGNVNVGIVGYIALRPEERSKGLGPRLRQRLRRAFEQNSLRIAGRPLDAIVGEVSADNPWLHHVVRQEQAVALDFPYYQPSLGHKKKAVPLVLYYQPLREKRKSIPTNELRRLLYTMWRRTYRVARPLSKPAFRKMLKSLKGRRRIGQMKLRPRAAVSGGSSLSRGSVATLPPR
jgi:hypothetical protein